MNQTDAASVSLEEFEFDIPCANCDEPAVVFSQLSHSANGGCMWSRGSYDCRIHYQSKVSKVANWLKTSRKCTRCQGLVSGTVSDNMRFVEL